MVASDSNGLSERELEILRLVATGASNKEIAYRLYISTNTVKVHLRNIFTKIGATSRTEAAMYAVRIGVVPSDSLALDRIIPEGSLANPSIQIAAPLEPTGNLQKRRGQRFILPIVMIVLIGLFGLTAVSLQRPGFFPFFKASPTPTLIPSPTPIQRWTRLADMPTARSGLAAATYENKIYAIGGETVQGVTGVVEQYDPEQDKWRILVAKPVPVADIQAATIGGKIYVPGGRTAEGSPTNVLEIYDPRSNQWTRGQPLPTAISAYALAAYEGKLYLFGGWDGDRYLDSVYSYDPSNGEWLSRTPMPTARGFAGAAVAGGKIYVIGGLYNKQPLDTNEVYSPDLDSQGNNPWSRSTNLPSSNYGLGLTSISDIIYVINGNESTIDEASVLQYRPQQQQWLVMESPPGASIWPHSSVTNMGSRIYIMGGQKNKQISADNLAYQAVFTVIFPFVIP